MYWTINTLKRREQHTSNYILSFFPRSLVINIFPKLLLCSYLLLACTASAQVLNNKNALPDIGVVGANTLL